MNADRIAELLEPFLGPIDHQRLSTDDLNNISTYIDILLRWNTRINLTAIRDPEEIVTRHFGESFFAARHLFPATDPVRSMVNTLADVGSGAGFPGIPMKLWAPNIALTLIESNHKKATFLREVVRALTLSDVTVENVRAEALVPATFDVVTLRAVERFAGILPIAARLLAPLGRLALLISKDQMEEASSILSNLTFASPIQIPESRNRLLLIGTPVSR